MSLASTLSATLSHLSAPRISFAIESWAKFYPDAKVLFPEHYKELALDQDFAKLDIDEEKYEAAESQGLLMILTVRAETRLVGYYVAAITGHLHYKSSGLMAHTDLYYILPEFRVGATGLKIFLVLERELKARGVTKAYLSTKVHSDNTKLFELLGYHLTDKVFTKRF